MTTTILFLIAVTCSLVAFYYQRQVRIIDELPRSAPRNIQQRNRVEEFARTKGIRLIEKRKRGVGYLRAEDGDAASLRSSVITEVFGIENSAEIVMIHRGYDWCLCPRPVEP